VDNNYLDLGMNKSGFVHTTYQFPTTPHSPPAAGPPVATAASTSTSAATPRVTTALLLLRENRTEQKTDNTV
jgi:hypothetical protein